jgi:hypothetical protein
LSKLFVNPSDVKPPPQPSAVEQRKLTKRVGQNDNKIARPDTTSKKPITEEDNPDKATVKNRLNNFFGGLKKMVLLKLNTTGDR